MISSVEDTITAVATPSGAGAISVIRMSGTKACEIADEIFFGKIKLSLALSHTIHYGIIKDADDQVIDNVLVSVYKSPHSYTGEDSVEISTHGSPLISEKIISLLLISGARLAEPGEFTKRAFLNGKIDLAQAEAVIDLINARTEVSLKGARNQLNGFLSKKVSFLKDNLINAISLVELGLDFAEEDIEFIQNKELLEMINNVISEIDTLISSYSFGKIIKDGINVAIAGRPNVGKSSLLNYLVKESRVIVSEIPGTTRDIISEEISIDGILFKMYDTAGIRITENEIEKEGVSRTRDAIRNADIVILMNDTIQEYPFEIIKEISTLIPVYKIINVINKIDLNKDIVATPDIIRISAKTGEGIQELLDKLKKMTLESIIYTEKTAIVSNLRHYECLKNARSSLADAKDSIIRKFSGEFVSIDLRNAANNLSEIIGEVTTEDILNNIFRNFCIGK